jgi:hypothetical protein
MKNHYFEVPNMWGDKGSALDTKMKKSKDDIGAHMGKE